MGNLTREELKRVPKVELHRHLELTLRLSTVRDLSMRAGIAIPATDLELKKMMLVTEPMLDLESVLIKFLATQKLLSSEEVLSRITFEAIEDAYLEGIKILELRYAPTFIQMGHEHISFEKIHQAILKGIKQAAHLPIAVGLLATVQRTLPVNVAANVIDFAIEHRDSFVGVDLADNEVGFAVGPFAPHFLRAKKAGLGVTIHSGESDVPGSAFFVRDAIEQLGAERIGHGVQIYKVPEMIKFVRDHKIVLELCPTSNWLTNAVPSTAQHPFRDLMHAGVLVTVNSDDPGVFDIDLTSQYDILHREQAFTLKEFAACNEVAAARSFIRHAEKQKHWAHPIPAQK